LPFLSELSQFLFCNSERVEEGEEKMKRKLKAINEIEEKEENERE
jgi:hypothetical protein